MENATNDTDNLPTEAVTKVLQELLNDRFPKQEYTYVMCKASAKGDNYIGVVYRISVNFLKDPEQKPFSLILKEPPQNLIRRKQFFARPCFLRESQAYEEFLPLAKEFQLSRGIGRGFHEYPECYCSLTDEFGEAIFMEDLRQSGFELFNRFEQLSRSHVELVMVIYAKLHAVSFALKDQQMEKFRKFQQIKDIFEQRRDDVQLEAYFEALKASALATLDADRDTSYTDVLVKYFAKGSFFDLLLALIDGELSEPYAVVCHGDCWTNNILFKQENGRVVDARLIDWQVMRYASPVSDLMYFLFTCTTKQFRREYFGAMLDVYYKELSDHMERLGSDAAVLFPRVAFDEQVKCKGVVGLLLAMIVLPIITIKGEDSPDLEELSERIEAGAKTDLKAAGLLGASNSNAYNTRMRDAIIDCIDFGFI